MTEAERDKLHEMNGRIGGVEAAITHFKETWQRQDEEATDGRRRLYDKLEELIKTVAGLKFQVDQVIKDVADLKVSDVSSNNRHQQAIGSKKMLAMLWAGLVAMVTALAYSAVEIAHLLWPPKHP